MTPQGIKAYKMSDEATHTDFKVVFPVYIDSLNGGRVSFKYMLSHSDSNVFKFLIGEQIAMSVKSSSDTTNSWQTATFKLSQGFHVLQWIFTKVNSQDQQNDFTWLEMNRIEIAGILLPNEGISKCSACRNGFSDYGSSDCEACDADTYYQDP